MGAVKIFKETYLNLIKKMEKNGCLLHAGEFPGNLNYSRVLIPVNKKNLEKSASLWNNTIVWLPQIREQMSGPDHHVFTLKFLALKLVFLP